MRGSGRAPHGMSHPRVTELFERAIEIAPENLSAWLTDACAGDSALRSEVERLLRADARAARFMETPPLMVSMAAKVISGPAVSMPRQFGAYRVLHSIGVGGMGEVWLAERNDGAFEQRVAIKQLAYPTPGLLHRFRQERQILARLEHPHIARLIDGGVDAAGAPYLIMEYVEGVPITDYARAHALDVPARLRLFARVCEAVQYAHQNLVVHRDLKPSNIFVAADGIPKLLDFGIAKVLASTDEAAPTQTLARLLTPDYAAPEQFHGGLITTATDVYALGVVLYELLADTRPQRSFALDAASGSDGASTPPPSAALDRTTAHATTRRRALRGDLDRITLTALANDPARRYASAEALAADIQRHLEGRPIAARGDNPGYRLRKFARRNRYAVAAGLIVFAVCIAATIVSLHQARLAVQQADRAEAVRQFLVGVFNQASPDENKGQVLTAHQLLEKGEQQLAATPESQPGMRADLTSLIGGLYWRLGDYVRAEPLLKKAISTVDDPRVPDEIKARSLRALADAENEKRLFDSAIAHGREALQFARRAGRAGAQETANTQRAIAIALIGQGHANEAEPLLRGVVSADRRAHGEHSDIVVDDLLVLGQTLDELSRYDESASVLSEAIATARTLHGDLHSSVSNGYNELGLMLGHKGDFAASERPLRESLRINEQLYGANHRETLVARSNLLRVLENRGRFADALEGRLQLLESSRALSDTRPEQLAYAYAFVANDYRGVGELAQAETAYRTSLALWAKVQGSSDGLDSVDPLVNLALNLQLQGRHAEAETAFRTALAIESKHEPPASRWLNRDRGSLGNLLRWDHRYAEALQELRAARAALGTDIKGTDPILIGLQAQLSEAELDAGDSAQAEVTSNEALAMARKALPADNYRLGAPLFASARAKLALGKPAEAEALLREALSVRGPPLPGSDLRVLEVNVSLAAALAATGKNAEAGALVAQMKTALQASPSPYAADLRTRLPSQ